MNHFRLFFVCLLGLFVASIASVAMGQVGADLAAEAVDTGGPVAAWVAAAAGLFVIICNALTTIFPSTNKLMAIVDAFAFSWGKARNDPAAQKWGG